MESNSAFSLSPFRTNGAIIKGFEEDVGSRTSFYTFSTNTLLNSLRRYAGLGFKAPPKGKVMNSPSWRLF